MNSAMREDERARERQPLYNMTLIKRANEKAGKYFFSRGAMRFFNSRIGDTVHFVKRTRGAYFVTSERFDDRSPRLYTIRYASPDGVIHEASEFQQYATSGGAHAAARRLRDYAEEHTMPRCVDDVVSVLGPNAEDRRSKFGVIEVNLIS